MTDSQKGASTLPARALWSSQIEELARADWVRRRELVAALAHAEGAVPLLIDALCSRREDEARIAALVDALSSSPHDVESSLIPLRTHGDPAVLADVAQILGRRRRSEALSALIELTHHADDNVAVAAIEALGRTASPRAIDALVACVESNNFFRTFPAIDVLGRTADARAIEPLARLLSNPRYAFEAARALGRTADHAAVSPLVQLLDSPSSGTVRVGCSALSDLWERHRDRYGGATAVEESVRHAARDPRVRRAGQSLADADRSESIAICRVLSMFRAQQAIPFLLPLLDREPEVGRAAALALRTIGREADDSLSGALAEANSARRATLLPMIHKRGHAGHVARCLRDEQATVRSLACETLARLGSVEHTPELFELLEDESPRVVHAATAAIQALGSTPTEALALRAAGSSRLETRRAALRVLSYFGFPSGYPHFAAALELPELRDVAVQGLALLDDEQARARLIALAAEPDAKLRGAAMRALGQVTAEAATLGALRAGLQDSDPWVRYYACQALGRQRDEASVAAIESLVHDAAGQVRVAAIEALSHMTTPVAITALFVAAEASDVDVRRAALLGLGLARERSALPLLLAAVREDDAATRVVALSALAQLDSDEVVGALSEAARDPDEAVRAAAVEHLSLLSAPLATRALVDLAAQGTEAERARSALARPGPTRIAALLSALEVAGDELAPLLTSCLSRLRNEEGVKALFEALELPNRAARVAAAHSLAALGTREAQAALGRAAQTDEDPEVRRVSALHLAD